MSGILAVVAAAGDGHVPKTRVAMFALAPRDSGPAELRSLEGCALGGCGTEWEVDRALGGAVLTASDGSLAAAVDGPLFYRSDLERKLLASGVRAASTAPADLVLAAYKAWGCRCLEHLEGDFALLVWDARHRTLLAARDFGGRKPLFHAMVGSELVVASSVAAILAYPGCTDELNLTVLAEHAGFLTGSPTETCYRGVSRLPAGWCLDFRAGESRPRTRRFWTPPVFGEAGPANFREGAEELRNLLAAAVLERLDPKRPTALLLSGGFDSPALFAAGCAALATGASPGDIQPVSISYPPGDPGREDELIEAVAGHWGRRVTWVDSTRVPAFEDFLGDAARRDEPLGHPFAAINEAMMAAARDLGARVVLDGHGGDFLFQCSTRYYAELFRTGSWIELLREWRAHGGGAWRELAREAVVPALSGRTLSAVARVRGKPVRQRGGFGRRPSAWMSREFVARARLLEREQEHQPPREGLSLAGYEHAWYLTAPHFTEVSVMLDGLALAGGVERRSPFFDERVIRFAARRPRRERRERGETKRLLRASVERLLPAGHVAPRSRKTGVMTAYLEREMRGLAESLRSLAEEPVLGELGIIDVAALQRACGQFLESGSNQLGGRLLWTFQTEAWLRARGSIERRPAPAQTGILAPAR